MSDIECRPNRKGAFICDTVEVFSISGTDKDAPLRDVRLAKRRAPLRRSEITAAEVRDKNGQADIK